MPDSFNIKDTLSSVGDSLGASQIGELTSSLADNPRLLATLGVAGTGALAGGYLASRRKKRPHESKTKHLARILGAALVTGGIGAGATQALMGGADKLMSPKDPTDVGRDPVSDTVSSLIYNKGTLGGSAALTAGAHQFSTRGKIKDNAARALILAGSTDEALKGKPDAKTSESLVKLLQEKRKDLLEQIKSRRGGKQHLKSLTEELTKTHRELKNAENILKGLGGAKGSKPLLSNDTGQAFKRMRDLLNDGSTREARNSLQQLLKGNSKAVNEVLSLSSQQDQKSLAQLLRRIGVYRPESYYANDPTTTGPLRTRVAKQLTKPDKALGYLMGAGNRGRTLAYAAATPLSLMALGAPFASTRNEPESEDVEL